MTNNSKKRNDANESDLLDKAEYAMKTISIPDGPADLIAEETLASVLQEAGVSNLPAKQSVQKRTEWKKLIGLSTAISAAILFVVAQNLFQPQQTLAFEDLTKPFKNVKTLVYESVTVAKDGNPELKTESKMYFKEPGLSRTEMSDGAIVVRDEQKGVTLFAYTNTKTATVLKSESKSGINAASSHIAAPISWLKTANTSGEKLEPKTIDGVEAPGFAAQFGAVKMKIWGHPDTKKPLLIEMPIHAAGTDYILSMSNFVFDSDLPDTLFSVEPPAGFRVKNEEAPKVDLDLVAELQPEEHVQRFLKYYSELYDGEFPDQIDNPGLVTSITAKLYEDDMLTDAENQDLYKMIPSMGAIWTYRQSLNEFGYQSGVKLGEKDRLVFWYLPNKSERYKVVYGDLTIGVLTANDVEALTK